MAVKSQKTRRKEIKKSLIEQLRSRGSDIALFADQVDDYMQLWDLKEMLIHYLHHQEDVVTRRTQYDLNKAEERDHILQGLLIALDNIDEVVKIIRESANVQEAKNRLTERFGLDDVQAQAIVDMRLRALTGLEREKLEKEHQELLARIAELKAILADHNKLLVVIKDEINVIAEKFGDDRRSKIDQDFAEIATEDLIPNVNTVIAMTSLGYIKRMTVDNFKVQNRGGRGIKGVQKIENDYIEDLLMTRTHDMIMFFTSLGRVYSMKAYKIPEASRTARGTAIINLLELNPGEKVTAIIPILYYDEEANLFMVTKKGIIKKTAITEYSNIRRSGIIAINLREDDELIEVKQTTPENDIFLVTKKGMCIRFQEKSVRALGRTAMGVIGMNLDEDDEIVGMQIDTQGGGKGVKCYNVTDKTGYLIGVKAVTDEHEIMMINSAGIIIQIRACDFKNIGRITSGVKMMNLDEGIKVVKIAKVRSSEEEEIEETVEDNPDEETPAGEDSSENNSEELN